MRFLVDECTGPTVAAWLRSQGHDVFSVYDDAPSISDDVILEKAYSERRILITNDKDFGEKVYRERLPHHGIVLLRVKVDEGTIKVAAIQRLMQSHATQLEDLYVVVTDDRIRFGRE